MSITKLGQDAAQYRLEADFLYLFIRWWGGGGGLLWWTCFTDTFTELLLRFALG